MGKAKTQKGPPIPRQPMSRINFLLQAAHLLHHTPVHKLSNHYISTAKSVAKKTQVRLDPAAKRTICKRCDSLMMPGEGARYKIENKSKGGKKKWADVLVVECEACGAAKRFPVGKDENYVLWSQRPEILEGNTGTTSTQGQGQGQASGQGQNNTGGKGKGKGKGNAATTGKATTGDAAQAGNAPNNKSGTSTGDANRAKKATVVAKVEETEDTEMKDAEAPAPSEAATIRIQNDLSS
ncbi:Rpr2-domain-containing protein [Ascobolus immersus RN42]|uniref:Rpr2-domain-containing protein n=1 Tax=Ascobolus immersus RN42 TaxID=1160509 RepID=A0A3N4IAM8_ASCIM|nr:Rpr2-domain-containing protein [Ascobolus immersus RN42]